MSRMTSSFAMGVALALVVGMRLALPARDTL